LPHFPLRQVEKKETTPLPKFAPPQLGLTLPAPPRLDYVANVRAGPRRHCLGQNTLPQPGQPQRTERCSSDVGFDAVGTVHARPRRHCPGGTTLPPPRPDHSISFFSIGLPPDLKSYSHSQNPLFPIQDSKATQRSKKHRR
jgi:hypothetical protein